MKLYAPSPAELGAARALMLARFPADAARVGRGIDLVPKLTYTTAADRNGMWQRLGIGITVNADPGWTIPSTPDERRNASDPEDSTPKSYTVTCDHVRMCECWDHMITGKACRHVYAVMAYRAIINSTLDAMAQGNALDLRPAGRYEGVFDVVDCWGMTICSVIYLPRVDRWRCEEDQDVAAFAGWLTREEAQAEIVRPRARGRGADDAT